MKQKRLRIRGTYIYIGIALFTVLLNVFAWSSSIFCDAYIAHIFPVWVNTYGRIMGIFPFSVGEWMIVAGLVLLIIAITLFFAVIVKKVISALSHKDYNVPVVIKKFYVFFAWILLAVFVIMTLNCLILYHASTISEKYFGGQSAEYELTDVLRLRNEIVTRCNELSTLMERDEQGRVIYAGSTLMDGSVSDMQGKAVEAMQILGDGKYYPRPKALHFSDFMCQQHMQGYYFPFSMEANYNDVMHVMNKPFTMCHELAHLRGYIYEDEANFIGYLACIRSDDIYFNYSGYLSAFSYLENDLYRAKISTPDALKQAIGEVGIEEVNKQVYEDNIFVEQEDWDRINEKALISTDSVDKAADAFIDTNLKVNGVEDGALSYNRMVELLLQYYTDNSFT